MHSLNRTCTEHRLYSAAFPYIQTCIKNSLPLKLSLVDKEKALDSSARSGSKFEMNKSFVEKSLVAQIARLIGPTSLWSRESEEAQRFRERMNKLRRHEAAMRRQRPLVLPTWDTNTPVGRSLPREFTVKFMFEKAQIMYKMLKINGALDAACVCMEADACCVAEMTVKEVMRHLMQRIMDDRLTSLPPEDFIFKPVGFAEALYGDDQLINYEYVRAQLKKHLDVRAHSDR